LRVLTAFPFGACKEMVLAITLELDQVVSVSCDTTPMMAWRFCIFRDRDAKFIPHDFVPLHLTDAHSLT
jgi:hypothetical protein